MRNNQEREQQPKQDGQTSGETAKGRQQQTDPQKTELKGFTDPREELEPTLEDGTKAPDKAKE